MKLQSLDRRRVFLPHCIENPIGGAHLASVDEQVQEQGSLLGRADDNTVAVGRNDFKRPENVELQEHGPSDGLRRLYRESLRRSADVGSRERCRSSCAGR